jgi:hypothetical protein
MSRSRPLPGGFADVENLVKSDVDEKNLDEEIAKIKERLASKIADRQKARPRTTTDDDFFGLPTRNARSDDEMEVDAPAPKKTAAARRKRAVSEDEEDEVPAKKSRRAPAKTAAPTRGRGRGGKTVVSRESSVASNPPPARKTPTRTATTRGKKVPPRCSGADYRRRSL